MDQLSSSDGFNIKNADTNSIYVLPFGGDTSNNAPLDSSDNPVLLNHSTWLRIQLQQEDWGNIPENIRSTDIMHIYLFIGKDNLLFNIYSL